MSDNVDTAIKRVAAVLNMLQSADNELTYYFEQNRDYNDEVLYQLREAVEKLGYVLACLTTWDDDIEEAKGDTETKGFDTYYRGQKVGESKDGLYTYKTTTITCDDKPYKVEWTMSSGESIDFGYYRSEQAAADVVSNMHFDEYVAGYEVLDVWKTGKPYEIKNVGSFALRKEEGKDESKD